MLRKTLALGVVATALAAGAAPSASAYTGTSEAKALARQVLSKYKKVPAITTRESGDVFYCASVAGGFLDGPSTGCRSKAVAKYTRLLKKGKVVGAFGKTTARGKDTIEWVSTKSATYHRTGDARCWTKASDDPRFSGVAYGFLPNENLTISRRTSKTIVIKGTAPDFQELDTVDVKKKLFTREEFRSAGRHTVLDHTNLTKAPKAPSTKPLCDDSGGDGGGPAKVYGSDLSAPARCATRRVEDPATVESVRGRVLGRT